MFYKKYIFICVFIFVVIALGAMAGRPQKIVGGVYARDAEFPYLVSLRRGGNHFCGGAIIGPQHILTAAHCINGKIVANLIIVTGTNRLSSGGTQHFIKRAVVHPNYAPTIEHSLRNDIAVITLTHPMKISSKQRPINLASRYSYVGRPAVIAGWGHFERENRVPVDGLTKLNTQVEDISYCATKLNRYLYNEQICTVQSLGHGICLGDSGGPLIVEEEVIGIASFIRGCGVGYPDIYTNVYAYRNFIQTQMRP